MGHQPGLQQVDTTCGSLLRELQHIWDEVGESDTERDKMLLQLEQECLEVYRRKVDTASQNRAHLHQTLASFEEEFAALFSVLGEPTLTLRERRSSTLREQIASIGPYLEELRKRKDERARQFLEVKTQIAIVSGEIAGLHYGDMCSVEEQNLTIRRLEEYHAQLATLQKEKSERVRKVLEYVNLIHRYCSVMGMDFFQLVSEVHPSLDYAEDLSRSISNDTLDLLVKIIQSLEVEKRQRISKIKDLGALMIELWSLMDTPVQEQQLFEHVTCNIVTEEDETTTPSSLALGTLKQAEIEVERLRLLKFSKMKEHVLKKRVELEEVCRAAHLEPDPSKADNKVFALIESGEVDAADLLTSLEGEINVAKQEVASRKDIMVLIEKWMSACEEEGWLEDYNKDDNRFASKGAHMNLKRAEKARAAIAKLPALVDSLTRKARDWEQERNILFMFDGVRLLAMLNEYNHLRGEKEEEKRQLRDQKKLQEQLLNEKETLYGSKPSPSKNVINPRRVGIGSRASSIGGGQQPVPNRRLSLGNALIQPVILEFTRSGIPTHMGSSSKDTTSGRAMSTASTNYGSIIKNDSSYPGGKTGVVALNHPQAHEAGASRQPLYPHRPAAALQQNDVANWALLNRPSTPAAPYLKSLLTFSPNSTGFGDRENTTPRLQQSLEFSFEERRASMSSGDLQTGFWMGGNR